MCETVLQRPGELVEVFVRSPKPRRIEDDHDRRMSGLLLCVRQKDETALTQFYDATNKMVYGYVLRILKNPADAEEVLVDVYRQIWQRAEQYSQDRGSALGWLMAIARTRSIDLVRRNRVHSTRQEPDENFLLTLADSATGPEEDAVSSARRRHVGQALARLTEEQREAIVWAFVEGYTHSEIAKLKGVPLGTVKTRIRAGLLRMRVELEGVAGSI